MPCRLVHLSAVFVFCFLGCQSDDETTQTSIPQMNWTTAFPAQGEGAFLSVWGRSATDVWTVGGPDMKHSRVWHFNGSNWKDVPVEEGPLLNWVHGSGKTVWMVGNDGRIVRRVDQEPFKEVSSGETQHLWGVWAASEEEAFAVGGDPLTTQSPDPIILHFKDGQWTRVEVPETEQSFKALFKVWGTAANNVFAVGSNGVILHYDGDSWTQQATGTARDFISLWGSGPNDIMAVGGRANGLVARYDGKVWTHTVLTGEPGMNGIWMDENGRATVVGGRGRILRFEPKAQKYEREVSTNRLLLHGVWGTTTGERFTVGGTLDRSPPWSGVALEYRGQTE